MPNRLIYTIKHNATVPPLTTREVTIEGIGNKDLIVEMLTSANEVLEVSVAILQQTVGHGEDLEEWVGEHAPFAARLTLKGSEVEAIELL